MNLPDLHDWEIEAILTDHNAQLVTIRLRFPETSDTASITFKGVSHFHASKMMLQNVILDVLIFETAVQSDYFEYCKKVLHISHDFFSENSQVKILYIEPSVGFELACSFTEIEFNFNK